DPSGVTVLRTPTAASLLLTPGHRSGRSFVWHDARVRGLPAGIDRGRWTIPLLVDGRRARLAGELLRVDAPPVWPWLALGLPLVGLAVVARGSRDARVIAAGALGLLALAAASTKLPVFLHGVVLSAFRPRRHGRLSPSPSGSAPRRRRSGSSSSPSCSSRARS